jgi:Reverse transcriptase (RNA-dependent DNA polymerase)
MCFLNNSYIALMSKTEQACKPNEFRPTSLLNSIQKMFSKVLACRIQPYMGRLLTEMQINFLKGRNILHGFHYAREVIGAANRQKEQMVVFKPDIKKAFDSMLASVRLSGEVKKRIHFMVLQGSSQVLINSVPGRQVNLKRGVRQGDPISPYIFNIAIDFFARWINMMDKVKLLQAPIQNCRMCLLYADDALVFLKPQDQQLRIFMVIMQIFHQLSG